MTVKDFVERWTNIVDGEKGEKLRNDFLTKEVKKTNYVEYATKLAIAKSIVQITTEEKDVNGQLTGRYRIDSPGRNLLFILNLIDLYTNIDINFKNVSSDYDLLAQNELIGVLINVIPEYEREEFGALLDMTLDDRLQNEMSFVSFLRDEIDKAKIFLIDILTPILNDIEENFKNMDEKEIQKTVNKITKLFK